MLNSVTLMGRITSDVTLRQVAGGMMATDFSIACQRDYKNKKTGEKETDFINVSALGSTADYIGKYFQKGMLVAIDGRLQVSSWVDEGGKHSKTSVMVANIYSVGNKSKDVETPQGNADKVQTPLAAVSQQPNNWTPGGGYNEFMNEGAELPF